MTFMCPLSGHAVGHADLHPRDKHLAPVSSKEPSAKVSGVNTLKSKMCVAGFATSSTSREMPDSHQ